MQITGIVLAGGKSSRMGEDKALLMFEGETLLKRSVKLCQSFCSSILISSNNPNHAEYGSILVQDEIEGCGPIGGIYSCLKQSKTNWNFVVSVDSPFVNAQFVHFMMNTIQGFDAVVPIHSRGKEPLIALYHKNCTPVMKELLEKKKFRMHNFLDKIKTKYLNAADALSNHPKLFYNLNSPEDLGT